MFKPKHLNWLLESNESWNAMRDDQEFRPRLGGVDISSALIEAGRVLEPDNMRPDLRKINLFNADLARAQLMHADLTSANLALANLKKTRLWYAQLHNANLTASEPSQAFLFPPIDEGTLQGGSNSDSIMTDTDWRINSVSRLLTTIKKLKTRLYPSSELKWYFRGEACDSWNLAPSVMRKDNHRENEGEMLTTMMIRQPSEFASATSWFAKLVIAQHHKLPTRLLDITSNPLVALYNATEDHSHCGKPCDGPGRIYVFGVPGSLIVPYDSDKISVISNFVRLSRSEKDLLLGRDYVKHSRKYHPTLERLVHFIKREKPYFVSRIDPLDLFRVFVVLPEQGFDRIKAQSGAFLMSAFHERFERHHVAEVNQTAVYDYYTMIVPHPVKSTLSEELNQLEIKKEKLFPSLDETADAIKKEL